MCPTLWGRVESRVFSLIGPIILATLVSLATWNPGWIITIGIYLVMGVTLDITVYARLIRWQPPWLTGVLAVGEFFILFILVKVLQPGRQPYGNPGVILGIQDWQPIALYWVSWMMATVTRIVIFPLVSLTRLEDGAEFRRPTWTIPPEREQLPILAAVTTGPAQTQLVRELTGVHQIPNQTSLPEPKPALSGEHRRPGVR